MKHEITDHGDTKKYWTQIPNIIFTLGLSPYELTLYNHLKRTAGAKSDGKCSKSTRALAQETKMSTGMVSKAKTGLEKRRPELGNKALISTKELPNPRGGKPYQEITIIDIWKANVDLFTSSPNEHEASNQVHDELGPSSRPSSPHEIKKNYKEELYKEELKPSSPHSRLMDFLQTRNGPIANGSKEGKAIKWLLEHGYDPQQCMDCFDYLAAQEWRTTAVDWVTVQTNIGAWVNRNGNGRRPAPTTPTVVRVQTAEDIIAGLKVGLKIAPNYDISKDIAAIKDDEIRRQVTEWWRNYEAVS